MPVGLITKIKEASSNG